MKPSVKIGGSFSLCLESMTRSRESSMCSSDLLSSQWQVLMRKFSADSRSKQECTLPPVDKSTADNLKKFPTGSTYVGQWNALGMTGYGVYTFPNGMIYEGDFDEGVFHGNGELRYPGGITLRGRWRRGVMVTRTIHFDDGTEHDGTQFDYCVMPDRRFTVERKRDYDKWQGLRPGTNSYMTAEQPSRELPLGFYDTGSGLYDPKTGVAYHYDSITNMARAMSEEEKKWTVKNCRIGGEKTTGPRPDLYERWWDCKDSDEASRRASQNASAAWRDDADDLWRRMSLFGANRHVIKFDPDAYK